VQVKLGAGSAGEGFYQSLVCPFDLIPMSQLGTELIPHNITEKGISITLMYSKTSQQILFVEAGKDFVDLVVGFLTLPIGCVIKLLSESELYPLQLIVSAGFRLHSHSHHASETLKSEKQQLLQEI
jgi:hypothetical protein